MAVVQPNAHLQRFSCDIHGRINVGLLLGIRIIVVHGTLTPTEVERNHHPQPEKLWWRNSRRLYGNDWYDSFICNRPIIQHCRVQIPTHNFYLRVAQFGSALVLGTRGRVFKSHHEDHLISR